MGTRYSAVFYGQPAVGAALDVELQAAVDLVDGQMSNWTAESDLNRLNRAAVGTWVDIPEALFEVLRAAVDIERGSAGAFNIAVGNAVCAAGFGPTSGVTPRASPCPEASSHLELESGRARKHAAMTLDLNGIAKGYGVDRMAGVMNRYGLTSWLVGIDGEMRARGRKPNGEAWAIGHETPDRFCRTSMGVIELQDLAVATSGNYRHWREQDGQIISHTIAPHSGQPLCNGIASATVLAPTCVAADAWATVLLVLGHEQGGALVTKQGFDWIVVRDDGTVSSSF